MLIVRHLTTGVRARRSVCAGGTAGNGPLCAHWRGRTYFRVGTPAEVGDALLVADVVERRSGEQDAEAGSRAAPLASSYAVLPSWP